MKLRHEMPKPYFSVIIPTYNRATLLCRCLESLTRQTFEEFEVIVSDDGSTDSTADVIDMFRSRLSLQYIKNENFGGPAKPRNVGLEMAGSDFVAFLDSDDWWEPAKLECCLKALRSGADVVYHDLWQVAPGSEQKHNKRIFSGEPLAPVFRNILCAGISMPNSSVVARTELLRQVGGFCEDPMLIAVEDLDCWLKIAMLTDRFERIPRALGSYWSVPGSISTASALQVARLKVVYDRHIGRLPSEWRSAANAFFYYRAARIHHACGNVVKAKAEYCHALRERLPLEFQLKSRLFLTTLLFK